MMYVPFSHVDPSNSLFDSRRDDVHATCVQITPTSLILGYLSSKYFGWDGKVEIIHAAAKIGGTVLVQLIAAETFARGQVFHIPVCLGNQSDHVLALHCLMPRAAPCHRRSTAWQSGRVHCTVWRSGWRWWRWHELVRPRRVRARQWLRERENSTRHATKARDVVTVHHTVE